MMKYKIPDIIRKELKQAKELDTKENYGRIIQQRFGQGMYNSSKSNQFLFKGYKKKVK